MIRIHFIGGGSVDVDLTMADVRDHMGEGGWAEYPQGHVLVFWDRVTHVQEFDPLGPPPQSHFEKL